MLATDAVRNLIRKGDDHQLRSQISIGRAEGMMTMEQSLAELVRAGPHFEVSGVVPPLHRFHEARKSHAHEISDLVKKAITNAPSELHTRRRARHFEIDAFDGFKGVFLESANGNRRDP